MAEHHGGEHTFREIVAEESINAADVSGATSGHVLKKAASGNDLEFGEESSGLFTRLASGTVTGIASGDESIQATGIGNVNRTVMALGRITDTTSEDLEVYNPYWFSEASILSVTFSARWDNSATQWDVHIDNGTNEEHDVEWQLLEVSNP